MPTARTHDSTSGRPTCEVCRRLEAHNHVLCFDCFRAERARAQNPLPPGPETLPFMRPVGESSPAPAEQAGPAGRPGWRPRVAWVGPPASSVALLVTSFT